MKKITTMFGDIDLVAARKLNSERFVDDLLPGGTREQVAQFVGPEDKETHEYTGTMPEIMKQTGFRFKGLAWSGEEDRPKLEKVGSAVFGHPFSTASDQLAIDLTTNVSTRRRGIPMGPDLVKSTLYQLADVVLRVPQK